MEVRQLKPGMTRGDLLKVFTTEGVFANRISVDPVCWTEFAGLSPHKSNAASSK